MELLTDPCNDRVVKKVPAPPARPITREVLYRRRGEIDLDILREHLYFEGRVAQELMIELIDTCKEIFAKESTLLLLKDPITVVGDIHGQYYDFIKMLEPGGLPGETTQYLFLGDYVDRGAYSTEVIALLFAAKIKYPKRVWMLRGNHECRQMTSFFNFRDECEHKYDISVYIACMEAFDNLPLAAIINGKFLAVHGGLSPELTSLKQIAQLYRVQEPPREGILCDLMWSDPKLDDEHESAASGTEKDGEDSKQASKSEPGPGSLPMYVRNTVRGCSWYFTYEAASHFLYKNSMLCVLRAHEAEINGYRMHRTNTATGLPTVVTVFSAPNYCDVYENKGAILKFENNTLNVIQYDASPHPYHLPNFMGVFDWATPFVVEKVCQMLHAMLQPDLPDDDHEEEHEELPDGVHKVYRKSLVANQNEAVNLAARLAEQIHQEKGGPTPEHIPNDEAQRLKHEASHMSKLKADRLKMKVRTVGRMAAVFKSLREEHETILKLKGICPGHKLAPALVLEGREQRNGSRDQSFSHAASLDLENEQRPIPEAVRPAAT